MITRPVEVRDLSAVVAMGRRFQETSNFAPCGFNEQKFAGLLLNSMQPASRLLALVAEHHGKIVGFFVASVSTFFFSDALTAKDNAIYVAPEHRELTRDILPQWLDVYEAWARAMGAIDATLGCNAGTEGRKFVEKILERGYIRTGEYMTMRM